MAVSGVSRGLSSFASTPGPSTVSVWPSRVAYVSSFATGAATTGVTVSTTVATLLTLDPFAARYVKVSVPVKPASGV